MNEWEMFPEAPPIGGGAARTPSPFAGAISSLESGGNYRAIGPATRTGDRAFGKYQVMGENIGPWTEEILGRKLSRQEFLLNPEAQDRVFERKFGSYAEKYGPQGAARAWFAGEGGMNDPNRRDILGTSVADYGRKFDRALGPQAVPQAPVTAFAEPNRGLQFPALPQRAAAAPQVMGDSWDAFPVAPAAQTKPSDVAAAPTPTTSTGAALVEGGLAGASGNFRDEIFAASKASGLPDVLGGFRAPIGAAKLAYEQFINQPALRDRRERLGIEQLPEGPGEATQEYDRALAEKRAAIETIKEEHPGAFLTGEVAGAVLSPAARVGAAARGATVAARALQSAKGGAAFGALSGAGAGEDLASRASGAATGAVVGGATGAIASPIVEGVVRGGAAVARPVVTALRGIRDPEGEAARRTVGALTRDIQSGDTGLAPAEFAAERAAGTPVTLTDLGGETTRSLARSAANTSQEARATLTKPISERFEGQGSRIVNWLNETFHYPNAQAQQEAIDQVAKTVNRPGYLRAFREPSAQGMWDEGFEQITQAPVVQDAIRKASVTGANDAARLGLTPLRNPFTMDKATGRLTLATDEAGNRALPNLQFWDQVKKNLDKVGTRESQDWSRVLRTRLDELVPSYGEARAGAAKFFGAGDALEAGQNFVTSKLGNKEARAALGKMSTEERQLFQDGFVSRFMETIGEIGDRRSVLNYIAQSPAAKERLSMALGPQKAAELEARLRVEGVMDLARSAIQGNSTTARQLAELGLAGGTYGIGTGGDVTNPNASAVMNAALVYGAARGKAAIDQRVARKVGEMLASSDPAVLQKGIQIVARNGRFMDALRSTDKRLAAVGGQQGVSVPAIQAPGIGRTDDERPSAN